jgi:hypothetical protein
MGTRAIFEYTTKIPVNCAALSSLTMMTIGRLRARQLQVCAMTIRLEPETMTDPEIIAVNAIATDIQINELETVHGHPTVPPGAEGTGPIEIGETTIDQKEHLKESVELMTKAIIEFTPRMICRNELVR